MALDVEVGPFVSMGLASTPTTTTGAALNGIEEIDLEAGPNLSYQGEGLIDVRYFVQKDYAAGRQGSINTLLNSPYILSVDQIPAASAATPVNIAGAQTVTSGTAMTLAAATAGISTNVPFYPFKSSALTTANIALDFGFLCSAASAGADTLSTNGTATATASSLLAASNFYVGQWLIMPNAGATSTTTLITQVTAISGTSITLSPAPGQTITAAMAGSANVPNVTWPGATVPTATKPYLAGGVGAFLNPKESICRGVGVNAAASATGGVIQIQGWDIYGQPQTENITAVANSTVYGNKTWKFIQAAVPQFTDGSHNYSVGTSDLFGFVVRSDRWEYTNIFWNGAFTTASFSATGGNWTNADLTTPATSTTKDVRGTFQPSARGPNASVTSTTYASGSIRLAMFLSVPLYNVISATPNNPTPMFGAIPA